MTLVVSLSVSVAVSVLGVVLLLLGGEKVSVMVAGAEESRVRVIVMGTAGLWYLSRTRLSRQNFLGERLVWC